MRYLALILIILSAACQTENSSTLDKETYESVGGLFGSARAIMARSCVPCHSFHTLTQAQLVASGVLVYGNPDTSKLYFRLKGSTGTGQKDMPTNGSLSVSEVDTIKTWIQQATP